MLAAYASAINPNDPLSGLAVGARPDPVDREGWTTVTVKAAALNHHDLWSLRGVGLRADQLPMILGGDAAGVDEDGNEVVVHSVVCSPGWFGDDTLDPKRSLLSEVYDGALAEKISVPRRNLVAKPPKLSFEHAACMPTAWLTAYRMLFTKAQLQPGSVVLIQGAGGGVSTACLLLAKAAGIQTWVTSRSPEKRATAIALGADQVFDSGAKLPSKVDAVVDNVGEQTWAHSLRSLRPGGVIVTCGATTGPAPSADLNRVFFLQLEVRGSTMGTREELERLLQFVSTNQITPVVDSTFALTDTREGLARLESGQAMGKVVIVP